MLGVLKLGTYWTCYTWLPKFLQNQMAQPVGRSAALDRAARRSASSWA